MQTIKIFLGSSITELHDERLLLGDYLLNSVRPIFKRDGVDIELLKLENINSGYNGNSWQDEFNECDIFIFMFKRKVGKMTIQEFDMARRLQKKQQHEIYVYCFNVPETEKSYELKTFQHRLFKESYFWYNCKDVTDLESSLILGLLNFKNQLLGKPTTKDIELCFNETNRNNQSAKSIDELLQQIETIMANENDSIDTKVFKVIELYKKADQWAADTAYDKEKYSDLLFDYAQFLNKYGLYKDAEAVYLRQIELAEELYGKEHSNTAMSYNNIGSVYYSQGNYNKALEYYFKALAIREKVLGTEHPSTATSYNNIGLVFDNKGDYDKALEYYQNALETREKALGTKHPETATSYNNIAGVCFAQGDYSKALMYYQKALAIREKALGTEHPDTATSYNNIGMVYKKRAEYAIALEYYFKALKIREKCLGMIHPATASSYNDIGTVYDDQGDHAKALEYYQKALEIREKVLGTEHPDTATSYNNIGTVYWKQGDYVKAIEDLHKAFSIIDKNQKQFDYESYTFNLLLDYIKDYLKENNATYLRDYYYSPKGGEHSTRTMCDLAVLNSEGKLLRVYEICTFAAFESNTNYIQKDLNQIKKETGAEVFLAFTVIKNKLTVLSLSEIETINKKGNQQEQKQ